MSGIATAIVGGAVIGGVASSKSASVQADAASESSAATLQAARETNEMQWDMYEQTRADQEPWRQAGVDALARLEATPDFSFDQEDFFADPSYDFRMQEGVNALDRSAASRGRILSGAQDKAITSYGSNLASTEYSNAYNRALTEYNTNLAKDQSLAQVGQSATNALASTGANTASNIANTSMVGATASNNALISGANATAAGYTGVASSVNQGIGNYLLYNQSGS